MKSTRAVMAAYLLVGATVLVGWAVGLKQLLDEGWIAGGGTGWLLGAALLATIAAAAAAWLHRDGRHWAAGVCLLVVAVSSPTVFAYPLNVAVIIVALVLIGADQTVFTQTIVVDGQVAGNIVSWEASGHQEVGYWIDRDFWGRGVGTKALAPFLDQMKVRPLHAYVAPHNIGSIRVLEKSGFRRVAAQDVPPSTADDGGVEHVVFVLEN